MPSPFPGVDPYIESQGYWPDLHASLILYARDRLNEVLPESHVARVGEQLRLVEHDLPRGRPMLRDVAVLAGSGSGRAAARPEAGVLTLEPVTLDLPAIEVEEVRDTWIEIRRRPGRELVTAIEILSPNNKTETGSSDYLAKRHELIEQPVHLVELDLLLRGHRLPMGQDLPPADFYALVSRAERRPKSDVFAWTIRHPLPTIPIPLRAPDPDVPLDLAGLFALSYDRGRYGREMDYAEGLDLPLPPAERAWAEGLARGTGA
ncbi:MAG: DUF4058 family protein [Isosphaeraceae bacterium]